MSETRIVSEGRQGPRGPEGPRGPSGSIGPTGPTGGGGGGGGSTGPTGPAGAAGATGATGPLNEDQPSYLPGLWTETSWATPSDQAMTNGTVSGGVPVPIGGSIVGIACQLKLAITAGSLTITILADSVPIASLVLTTGSPTFTTFAPGVNVFSAGQLITAELAASADEAPVSSIDVSVQWSPAT
jgi:hypothetical protein